MYGLEAEELDVAEQRFSDGTSVAYDTIHAEKVSFRAGDRTISIPAGATFILNNRIVRREWPSAEELVTIIRDAARG